MSLTDEQAQQLGTLGRELSLALGQIANDFCVHHKMSNNPQAFNATMMTLIETVTFVTLTGAFHNDPAQQKKTADEIAKGIRKLLRNYAIHKQLETLRNHHPKGKSQ